MGDKPFYWNLPRRQWLWHGRWGDWSVGESKRKAREEVVQQINRPAHFEGESIFCQKRKLIKLDGKPEFRWARLSQKWIYKATVVEIRWLIREWRIL